MKTKKSVLIVGAGVGGLATAIRLAKSGLRVHVVEKQPGPGGRCGVIEDQGYKFDIGPTLLLLKPVFEELFGFAGKKLSDYLSLVPCDPNYNVHFTDGSSLLCTTNLRQMEQSLESIEPGSFANYLRYLQLGRKGMEVSLQQFVTRNFDSLKDFLTLGNLRTLFDVSAHRSLYDVVSRFFRDERLRIALSFQTMYLGISPKEAPAVYSLLPYTELVEGIWFPMGGMYAVPLAMEKLAKELGVTFEYNTPVEQLLTKDDQIVGARLENGSVRVADTVVVNADLPYAYRKLIPWAKPPRLEKMKYTSSCYMLYLGLDRQLPMLNHHNVFMSNDFMGNFNDIFARGSVPYNASFYANVPNRTDPSLAPPGCDQLYVLVPVPNLDGKVNWAEEGPKLRARVLSRLSQHCGIDIEKHIRVEHVYDPNNWQQSFNLERGAAFGLSHNLFQVGVFRPANQDPRFRNLFFVGASTQPGTGLPMVCLSARLTTERVLNFVQTLPEEKAVASSRKQPEKDPADLYQSVQ